MKILVLGHTGMLGHMVVRYLTHLKLSCDTIEHRWPSEKFKKSIKTSNSDFLINCIACIPQKHLDWNLYKEINIILPIFLSNNFKGKIINPTSDCEFSGNLKFDEFYNKDDIKDATDDYGISKTYVSNILVKEKNVKQIRTSIIGPEIYGKVSLMEWFFKQIGTVNGYSNHYWNGVTTLEWTKQAYKIINDWDDFDKVTQIGTDKINKYELLCLINKIFESKKNIISINVDVVNRCLKSDYEIKSLENQLIDLKKFYYEN